MSDISAEAADESAALLESQLREARAEAAGYRAHNEALQLQVVELNGELAAAETQIVALRASHAELVAACDELLKIADGAQTYLGELGPTNLTRVEHARAALANARKVVAP
jgi:chromosome segregation ATPase